MKCLKSEVILLHINYIQFYYSGMLLYLTPHKVAQKAYLDIAQLH